MNHTRRMVLVPENTLESLQQRHQILTPPVTQTLKHLDSEMSDILSSKELDDEAKAKLYNQVLQRYLTKRSSPSRKADSRQTHRNTQTRGK